MRYNSVVLNVSIQCDAFIATYAHQANNRLLKADLHLQEDGNLVDAHRGIKTAPSKKAEVYRHGVTLVGIAFLSEYFFELEHTLSHQVFSSYHGSIL